MPTLPFDGNTFKSPPARYVAFLDVLGFGDLVSSDWSTALGIYESLTHQVPLVKSAAESFVPLGVPQAPGARVAMQVYSDSIVLVGEHLYDVADLVQGLQTAAIFAGCLLRGCIAHGPHAEQRQDGDTYILSKALVLAARGERNAIYPRVVLDSSIAEEPAWAPAGVSLSLRLFLRDNDDVWMVNPFAPTAVTVCGLKLQEMLEHHQQTIHAPKYAWIRNLHARVAG